MPERRRPFTRYVDEDGTSRLSINPKTWKGVLGLIGTIISTSVLISGIVLSMLKPVVSRWIHEETRPSQLEMSASIVALQTDIEELRDTSATRSEIDARMARMEGRLDDIYRLLANGR